MKKAYIITVFFTLEDLERTESVTFRSLSGCYCESKANPKPLQLVTTITSALLP